MKLIDFKREIKIDSEHFWICTMPLWILVGYTKDQMFFLHLYDMTGARIRKSHWLK